MDGKVRRDREKTVGGEKRIRGGWIPHFDNSATEKSLLIRYKKIKKKGRKISGEPLFLSSFYAAQTNTKFSCKKKGRGEGEGLSRTPGEMTLPESIRQGGEGARTDQKNGTGEGN